MENYIVIYAIVPKHIYETKLLTPEEKLIAERIIYLCKKEGYCWITNKKLSEMYNITIEQYSTVLFFGGKNGENKGFVN